MKKRYRKPQITIVELDPQQAILACCSQQQFGKTLAGACYIGSTALDACTNYAGTDSSLAS